MASRKRDVWDLKEFERWDEILPVLLRTRWVNLESLFGVFKTRPRLCVCALQNGEVRLQFQEFLSLNGHQLEQRPFPDVVQLALAQPHSSEVYRQALLQAQDRASRGKLYVDWVYAFHTRPHTI